MFFLILSFASLIVVLLVAAVIVAVFEVFIFDVVLVAVIIFVVFSPFVAFKSTIFCFDVIRLYYLLILFY